MQKLNCLLLILCVQRSKHVAAALASDILAAALKPWASFFTLHCSSSLSCLNEYLTIDSGGYVYEQPSRINCSIWLDASQRSRDGI